MLKKFTSELVFKDICHIGLEIIVHCYFDDVLEKNVSLHQILKLNTRNDNHFKKY